MKTRAAKPFLRICFGICILCSQIRQRLSTASDFETTTTMSVSAIATMIYVTLNVFREILQLYQQRWKYLLDPTNLVSWLLYISSSIMVVPIFIGRLDEIQFSCASITVFLSWFNLLLLLQRQVLMRSFKDHLNLLPQLFINFLNRFDQVGIYVVMFLEILQTLIKVLLVFSILIIAFGLAFFILLSQVSDSHIFN